MHFVLTRPFSSGHACGEGFNRTADPFQIGLYIEAVQRPFAAQPYRSGSTKHEARHVRQWKSKEDPRSIG
jgi:hypothetical protein